MSKIIVVVGPTGVGKTRLSIELAKKYNAEIINADATQVYKDANIGTAKIKEEEKENIKHHLIDIVTLNANYTVKDYQTDARKVLDILIKDNKNVIIVGGSGLYIKALLYDYKFSEEENIVNSFENLTNEELKEKVDNIYKENNIHVNNRKRLERFLSHYLNTGEIIKNHEDKDKPLYEFCLIGLTTKRDTLYEKIDKRVEEMIKEGLVDEVKSLKNYKKTKSLIGYKEMLMYLNNEITLEEAKYLIKQSTRKYAKRQYTWFNNQFDNIKWFNTDYNNFDNTIKEVVSYIEKLDS